MKAKKLVSCILAGVMAVSMAVPAFASKSVKITAAYQDVVLDLIVPTTGKAYINPYSLPIDIPGETQEDGTVESLGSISGQQITTMPMYIANLSKVNLFVGADVTLTAKGSLKLLGSSKMGDAKGKEVSVTLETMPSALDKAKYVKADADAGTAASMDAKSIATECATATTWTNSSAKANGSSEITSSLEASATTVTTKIAPTTSDNKHGLAALKAADSNGEPQVGSVVLYRLKGTLNKAPKTGTGASAKDDPWVKADGFDAVIAFSFEPGDYPT